MFSDSYSELDNMETDAEFHSICDEISDKIDLRL